MELISFCPVNVPARELGFALNPEAWVYGIPAVSTYIGGDIVSGVLAARLDEAKDVTLFIDIGTNGEIVLSRRGRMHACSMHRAAPCPASSSGSTAPCVRAASSMPASRPARPKEPS